ncbi:MAG: M60 family metallopeptidase [Planctomycetota bacterium]|nr:M60 family metallopeptidase [Planctomycetota bacterium]
MSPVLRLLLPILAAFLVLDPAARAQDSNDLDQLLAGVFSLEPPTGALPGEVLCTSDESFTIASVQASDGRRGVIAATRHGAGRAVAFGHNAFLGDWGLGAGGGQTFIQNAIAWSGGAELEDISLLLLGRSGSLVERLGGELDGVSSHSTLPEARELERFDVVLWQSGDLDPASIDRLEAFVAGGGGLLFGVCPWGRQQLFDRQGKSIRTDLPHNQLGGRLGLVFGLDTAGGQELGLSPAANQGVHAGRAVAQVLAALAGRKLGTDASDPAAAARQTSALVRALPPGEEAFGPRIDAALAGTDLSANVPGPGRRIARSNTIGHLGMLFSTIAWGQAEPADVPAAPGHEFFPGSVPEDAERSSHRIVVEADAIVPKAWRSTGLYAPAGEVITAATEGRGWQLRIGAHKDLLWHKDKWSRWPEITMQQPIEGTTKLASPFGGLIYLVPTDEAARATTAFVIDGAIEAPFFDLDDEASRADWERRRGAPAPWGELACDGVILTLPSGALRHLEDPTELMTFWSRAMAHYPDLLGEPLHATGRPERLVEDLQISAGWMHSGYPVMTHGADDTDHSAAADFAGLQAEGNWGYFHEFGHNAQRPAWTFQGTTEVTCNLFSLYLGERMAGIEPWENPWLVNQRGKLAPYLAAGADFEQWKREPGLALLTYALVQREFGWEPIAQAIESYLGGGPAPKNDAEERDQWMLRLSRATGRDLGPYFQAFGIPTSESARAELADLEPWLPAELR